MQITDLFTGLEIIVEEGRMKKDYGESFLTGVAIAVMVIFTLHIILFMICVMTTSPEEFEKAFDWPTEKELQDQHGEMMIEYMETWEEK